MENTRESADAGKMIDHVRASIIIPTFNGASRIALCLDALKREIAGSLVEVLVIDDGSTDSTRSIVSLYPGVRLLSQPNSGPAAARNRGALATRGELLLFTDDDCVPAAGWLDAMLAPFADPEVVGVKGVYRTRQCSLVARFVQIEYEDKYRRMAGRASIDFVDTYSAAFRRDRFLQMDGYDTSFPVACAEDIELSYRMSAHGWSMKFAPDAVVFHTHPDTIRAYLKKKYKFAYWRVLAVRKNPAKGVTDSHTPQTMKLQLLLPPAIVTAAAIDATLRPQISATLIVLVVFGLTTLRFAGRAFRRDPGVGLLSPTLLAVRACAQFFGMVGGALYALRSDPEVKLARR